MTELVFVVPGRLDQLTGGYLYDRHVIEGLRRRGHAVRIIELPPAPHRAVFAAVPDGMPVVIDGLALPGLEDVIRAQEDRLRLLAMVHHPLAEETGLSPAETGRLAALEAALLPRFRGIICPSRETAAAVEHYRVAADRIEIVLPGTAKPRTARQRRCRRVRALLCVGSLTPRKGHRVLVEALRRLRRLDWSLLCVGSLDRDPATARAIRRMISAAGLDRRILLIGEWAPQRLDGAYAAADVFVLPSFHEGYGMAFAEAMAHGLPIVATAAGAIPDTVPYEAGLLVPPGDAASLAEALRRVIVRPGLADRLAAGSKAAGARLPEWPQATERWERAMRRLASLDLPTPTRVATGRRKPKRIEFAPGAMGMRGTRAADNRQKCALPPSTARGR